MDFTVTVYYTTGECPSAGMVFKLINRRPVRYFLAGAILTLLGFFGVSVAANAALAASALLCGLPALVV